MFGSEYSPSHLERTTRERNKKNNRKIQYIYFCQNKCDNVPTVEGSGVWIRAARATCYSWIRIGIIFWICNERTCLLNPQELNPTLYTVQPTRLTKTTGYAPLFYYNYRLCSIVLLKLRVRYSVLLKLQAPLYCFTKTMGSAPLFY